MTEARGAPAVGDRAPDASLVDLAGASVSLSSSWADGPAVIAFLRYFGCPFCQAFVSELRGMEDLLVQEGASIVLVGQGRPEGASAFTRRVHLPVLVDTDGTGYRAYGLARGSLGRTMGPQVWGPWVKANLSAQTRQRGLQGGSLMQLPGTFVVDGDGTVRFAHPNRHAADDPDPQALLRAVTAIAAA